MLINKYCIESLQHKINVFHMEGFSSFILTPAGIKIRDNFIQDGQVYETFYQQMIGKFLEENKVQEFY